MDLSTISKAIAGGIVALVVSWLAHYGVTLSPVIHDTVASIALSLAAYIVGHGIVWIVPNKPIRTGL